jgi:uncharacterized protein DUF3617
MGPVQPLETTMSALRLIALATLSLSPVAALATDSIPARKAGLWEINSEMSMMPGQKMSARRCIGPNGDGDLLDRSAQERKNCGEAKISRKGAEIITDVVCKVESSTATMHGVFSGDFQNHYAGRMDTTYAPPLRGMASSSMSLNARWVGPCAPGQKPGDTEMTMPGGRINLQEMMKNMPAR